MPIGQSFKKKGYFSLFSSISRFCWEGKKRDDLLIWYLISSSNAPVIWSRILAFISVHPIPPVRNVFTFLLPTSYPALKSYEEHRPLGSCLWITAHHKDPYSLRISVVLLVCAKKISHLIICYLGSLSSGLKQVFKHIICAAIERKGKWVMDSQSCDI